MQNRDVVETQESISVIAELRGQQKDKRSQINEIEWEIDCIQEQIDELLRDFRIDVLKGVIH